MEAPRLEAQSNPRAAQSSPRAAQSSPEQPHSSPEQPQSSPEGPRAGENQANLGHTSVPLSTSGDVWGAPKPGQPRAHWQLQPLRRREMATTALHFPNFGFSKPQEQDPEPEKAPPGASILVRDCTKRLQDQALKKRQSSTRLARKRIPTTKRPGKHCNPNLGSSCLRRGQHPTTLRAKVESPQQQ